MYLLIALLLGTIGAAIVWISKYTEVKTKAKTFFILTTIYTGIGWWILYGGLPSMAWPLLGFYFGLIIIWWIVSTIVSLVMEYMADEDEVSWYIIWFPVGTIVILIITYISGWAFFGRSDDYTQLIGKFDTKNQKHWSQDIQPLDPTHIRLVPDSVAIYLAKTAVAEDGNTLGSQFPIAAKYTTLQKIGNDYFYLIPLDYEGYKVWTRTDYVPGYVKVSATDPKAKPILVTGKKMKYTPGAFFGDDLKRKLYWKYNDKVLKDFSFEEDDNGNIYWVITVCQPTISYWGLEVEGVILFDPESGEDQFITTEQVNSDSTYAWIDRVIPKELVESYINYWGSLKDGWWNSVWTHLNILEAETPTLNYSADGRCMFVTPVTSNNNDDQAMTGLMYTDARTGEFIYYTNNGGATEEDIIDAVNAEVKYKQWHASEQIVYENVYGYLAALVPVLGSNGTYQSLAIVRTDNRSVAIGTTPQEALIEFQKIIMSSGSQISTENTTNIATYTGKVSRIGWDMSGTGKQYYLYFEGIKHSFMVSSITQSELALTQVGDNVTVTYYDSKEISVPTLTFKNLTLNLQKSANETSVDIQKTERKEEEKIKGDVKDFKEELKNMSDDDIKKLMEKQKK